MESLKAKINELGLTQSSLRQLLSRRGGTTPAQREPLKWYPRDIERFLDSWSQTLECKVHQSGCLHRYHYAPGEYLTDRQIIQLLGFRSAGVLNGLQQNHGMPAPEICKHYFFNQVIETEVWKKALWNQWFISYRAKQNGEVRITKLDKPTASKSEYPKLTREWVHGVAADHGRHLTHTITIGFKSEYGRDDDPKAVQRINEQERAEAGKLAKKLPNKVWRKFEKANTTPSDKFFFCVYPEGHTKYGGAARWHFHVELFLTDVEARFLDRHWEIIEAEIRNRLQEFAAGRIISIQFESVDSGYASYCSKDAFTNIDMIECNFLSYNDK